MVLDLLPSVNETVYLYRLSARGRGGDVLGGAWHTFLFVPWVLYLFYGRMPYCYPL